MLSLPSVPQGHPPGWAWGLAFAAQVRVAASSFLNLWMSPLLGWVPKHLSQAVGAEALLCRGATDLPSVFSSGPNLQFSVLPFTILGARCQISKYKRDSAASLCQRI